MLTVIHPFSPCFAGNPIVVKATTDKVLATDESLLRIVLEATFKDYYYDGAIPRISTVLSSPVPDNGTAVYNLSDAAQGVVQNMLSAIDMNHTEDSDPYLHYARPRRIIGEYRLREVWIRDGYETGNDWTETYQIDVIPGRYTDYEMLLIDDISLDSRLGESPFPIRPLTRKPDLGIVYKGETVILPVCPRNENTNIRASLSVNGEQEYVNTYLPTYMSVTCLPLETEDFSSSVKDGGLVLNSSTGVFRPRTGYLRTNADGVHFLRFINGFGTIENISVRSKDKLSYEVSGDTHSLVQKAGVRPTDRRYATKSQPAGVYELSSGYVPQQWAEWYVQELITSPRVWMQIGGKWVPALIEAKDDCVIYDRTKPEMPHVDFTLRLAIDGVTGVTW